MGFVVGWTIFLVVIFLANKLLGNDCLIVTLGAFSMMAFFTLLAVGGDTHLFLRRYSIRSSSRVSDLGLSSCIELSDKVFLT